jgi:hypothetical protein
MTARRKFYITETVYLVKLLTNNIRFSPEFLGSNCYLFSISVPEYGTRGQPDITFHALR